MTAHHLHLLLNHLPIIGLAIGLAVLIGGLLAKHSAIQMTGLLLTVITGLATIPANLTGEGAESVVENLPQVSEAMIEAHESAAERFLVAGLVTAVIAGLSAFVMVVAPRRWKPWMVAPTLLSGLLALSLAWDAGATGGQIRRPELRNGPITSGVEPIPARTEEHD